LSTTTDEPASPSPTVNLRRYWRVPVVALLAALLGFMVSYVFPPTYQANTKLLVRVNDTTLLSSRGTTPGLGQPQVIDQTGLAKAVAQTQGALLTNNVVATSVVRKLRLDEVKDDSGSVVGALKGALRTTLAYTYGYVVHGTYKKLAPFPQAVKDVQDGLSATQLDDSYMIVLSSQGESPEQAVAIGNSAADDLVRMGDAQFRADVEAYSANLLQQVTKANTDRQQSAAALARFSAANGIDNGGATSVGGVDQAIAMSLSSNAADLAAAKATLEANRRSLASAGGQLRQSQQNAVYQAQAQVAALQARQTALLAQASAGADLSAGKRTQYLDLLLKADTAEGRYQALQAQYQQALVSSANSPVELTRVDSAVALTYPVAPKRYVYLGIGLILGAILGFLLTAREAWRRGETLFPREDVVVPASSPAVAAGVATTRPALRRPPDHDVLIELGDGGGTRRARRGGHEVFESTRTFDSDSPPDGDGRPVP
jgi:uncharacterized protein involved in exopolysaccharide biosynthesis